VLTVVESTTLEGNAPRAALNGKLKARPGASQARGAGRPKGKAYRAYVGAPERE